MENTEKLVMSITEAGKRLGLSRPTASKLAKSGELPTIKLGRKVVVSKVSWTGYYRVNIRPIQRSKVVKYERQTDE